MNRAMNLCIDIDVLEDAVLAKLNKRVIPKDITRHLAECAFCQERYDSLFSQYSEAAEIFPTLSEESITKAISSLSDESINPFYWTVTLWNDQRTTQSELRPRMTRAADSSSAPVNQSYLSKGVLSTEDGEIMVRLTKNSDTRDTVLHIISNDVEKYQNVLVSIEPLGVELMTDKMGRIDIGQLDLPKLEELKLVIKTPRTSFDLTALTQDWKEFIGKGEIQIKNASNDKLYIEFSPEGENYCIKVRLEKIQKSRQQQTIQITASKEGRQAILEPVKKGLAVFHEVSESPALRVKIFG
ncbi:MAG: hypothetical protein HQ556_16360 [Candidatus Marinimicrobia bacterium]|nr:hypothetical protein [Candidatus Neomarinimicrobiota bacterium]